MSKMLDQLFLALSEAEGETVEARMEYLIANKFIFTPNLDAMRTVARGFDGRILSFRGWVAEAIPDIEAKRLSDRLRATHREVSPEAIRANPEFWNERMISELEDTQRRLRSTREQRRQRLAR